MNQTTTNLAPAEPRPPFIISVEMRIDPQAIDNVLSDALDYCSYWCSRAVATGGMPAGATWLSETLTRGGELQFRQLEDPSKGTTYLTLEKFVAGAAKYAESHGKWVFSPEADCDAADADAVLQLALFGEIIYG